MPSSTPSRLSFIPNIPPLYRWLNVKGTVARLAGDYERDLPAPSGARRRSPRTSGRNAANSPAVELGLDQSTCVIREAEEAFEKALALIDTNQSQTSPSRADALVGLARVHLQRREPARALPLAEEAEAYWRGVTPECRSAGEAAYWLGRSLEELGRHEEAQKALARAAKISRVSPVVPSTP